MSDSSDSSSDSEDEIMGDRGRCTPKRILYAVLSVYNFILFMIGLQLMSDATTARLHFNDFATLMDKQYYHLMYACYALGVMVYIFGFVSFLRDNCCMKSIYYELLIVVYVTELVIIYACYEMTNQTKGIVADNMHKTINQYDGSNSTEITAIWDKVQQQLHCCGISNASDWIFAISTKNKLPMSCCFIPYGATDHFECNTIVAYKEGCLEVFGNDINSYISNINIYVISLAVIKVFGIFVSSCLRSCSNRE